MANIEKLKTNVSKYIEENASWLFEGENIDKDEYTKDLLEEMEREETEEAKLRAERRSKKKAWREKRESEGILTR